MLNNALNQTGQALLEITIGSGLALLIVTAITITTIIGIRNSQFAQNQIQATKYAQEGLELVEAIQSRNCPVIAPNDTSYYWYSDGSATTQLVWGSQNQLTGNFRAQADPSTCQLKSQASSEILQTKFGRQIQLASVNGNNQKLLVTSIVSWTDYSGSHQSQLVTILSND